MVRSNCIIPSLRSLGFQGIDSHMERDIITKKVEEETLTNVFQLFELEEGKVVDMI